MLITIIFSLFHNAFLKLLFHSIQKVSFCEKELKQRLVVLNWQESQQLDCPKKSCRRRKISKNQCFLIDQIFFNKFDKGLPKDCSYEIWLKIILLFQRSRCLNEKVYGWMDACIPAEHNAMAKALMTFSKWS